MSLFLYFFFLKSFTCFGFIVGNGPGVCNKASSFFDLETTLKTSSDTLLIKIHSKGFLILWFGHILYHIAPSCVYLCVCKVHPSREFFAVAEKGTSPDIIVYEYPSLRPGRILRGKTTGWCWAMQPPPPAGTFLMCMPSGGTRHRYSCVSFNHDGSLLASVGGEPDFLLTLWDWRREEVQSFQATSQEVHRVSFSHYDQELLTTAGCRHIK